MKTLKCEGKENCTGEVAYIDEKGFIYCETHGKIRQQFRKCRKLRKHELNHLKRGELVKKY